MDRKYLFLLLSLSLAFVACKDSVPEHVQSNKSASQTVTKSSKVFEAKVRSTLGHAELLKAVNEAWKTLRVGQNVHDNDRVRTAAESEVVLNAVDGTVFIISEKSDVEFNTAFQDSVRGEVNVFIKNGNIQFDVQKQKKKQFNFGTGTATASIRGTAGFVGNLDGRLVASLKEGLVEVKNVKGEISNIKENQTILVAPSGETTTLELESSGSPALISALNEMAKSGKLNNISDLVKALQNFDAGYAAEKKKFLESLNFVPVEIPKKISKPSITLKATLTPGVHVTIMGETIVVPESGEYEHTFTWDENAGGEKRFIATCSNGSVEVPCNAWNTEYVDFTPEDEGAPAEVVADTLSKVDKADSLQKVATVKSSSKKAPKPREPKFNLIVTLPPSDGAEVLETDAAGRDTLESIKVPKGEVLVNTDLKIALSGRNGFEMAQVDTIFIFREGKQEEFITDISDSSFTHKVTFLKNEITKYEVAAKLKDGTYVCAFKTYIVD